MIKRHIRFMSVVLLWTIAFGLMWTRGGYSSWFLVVALGVMIGYAILIRTFALQGASLEREISEEILTDGEHTEIIVRIHLHTLLPLIWLVVQDNWRKVEEELGEEDVNEQSIEKGKMQGSIEYVSSYSQVLFPWFRKRMEYRYRITSLSRGYYVFHEPLLYTGDLWGLFVKKVKAAAASDRITVYPYAVVWTEPIQGSQLNGTLNDHHQPQSEADLIAGVREYRNQDPMHHIHWKASARTGEWRTRVYETTTIRKVLIITDLNPPHNVGAEDDIIFEYSLKLAAGIYRAAEQQGLQPVLAVRGHKPVSSSWREACERLTRLKRTSSFSLSEYVQEQAIHYPGGTSIMVITPLVSEPLIETLMLLLLQGYTVQAVNSDSAWKDTRQGEEANRYASAGGATIV